MKALPILFFFAIALCAACTNSPLPDMEEVADEQGTRSDTDTSGGITITVDTASAGTIDYPF